MPGVDRIVGLAWAPTGRRLVLDVLRRGQRDLLLLDLDAPRGLTALTDDAFTDRDPVWTSDSTLVFASDRAGVLVTVGAQRPALGAA